jgi:hypothetical protein
MTPAMETYLKNLEQVQFPKELFTDVSRDTQELLGGKKDPQSPRINQETNALLRTYAKFAAASYCMNHDNLRAWVCGANCRDGTEGTSDVMVVDTGRMALKGWMGINDRLKSIIVSFRGTLEPQNFISNLFVWRTDIIHKIQGSPSDAAIHQGFWTTYADGQAQIVDYVRTRMQKYPDYKVTFTGHSLGAVCL